MTPPSPAPSSEAPRSASPASPSPEGVLRRVETTGLAGPERLRVVRAHAPATTPPDHARVRVLASSLTLSDSIVRRGLNPYTADLVPPFTLGYDFVGTVTDVAGTTSGEADGSGRTLRPTDLVVDMVRAGANADVLVRPVGSLSRVDVDIDPVLLEPLVMTGVTAYQCVRRVADVQPGQTVLVHGATGGVGLLAVEIAVLLGASVIATGSPAKHEALHALGARPVDGRAPDLADRISALAPDGVDVVLDGVGGPARDVVGGTVRPGGIFVGFGFAGPAAAVASRTRENLDHTARVFAEGQAALERIREAGRQAVEYEVGTAREDDRAAYDADLNLLAEHVAEGRLRPRVRPVAFDEVAWAHGQIDAGAVTGRLVLDHRLHASPAPSDRSASLTGTGDRS